ncbi:MAG: TerB family tellurite resistance protein [Pseudomonadota bacterium]
MHIAIALLGLAGALGYYFWRMRASQAAATDLFDVANDVRLAARRFGFKRQANVHPVDSIDDPRLGAAGIVMAIASLDHAVSQAEIDTAKLQCQVKFGISKQEADEIVTFGRWIADQCGSSSEAVRRLSKRVSYLAGDEAMPDLLDMSQAVATAEGKGLDEYDREALATIRRIFKGR